MFDWSGVAGADFLNVTKYTQAQFQTKKFTQTNNKYKLSVPFFQAKTTCYPFATIHACDARDIKNVCAGAVVAPVSWSIKVTNKKVLGKLISSNIS